MGISEQRPLDPVHRIHFKILLVSKKNRDPECVLYFLENSPTKKYGQPQFELTESLMVTNTTAPKTRGDEETVGTRSSLRGADLEPALGSPVLSGRSDPPHQVVRQETHRMMKSNGTWALDKASGMIPSDLPRRKTREQAGDVRGFSAPSDPHPEGQKEKDREREEKRQRPQSTCILFLFNCRRVHTPGTKQKDGR